jgi:hypothetical protein
MVKLTPEQQRTWLRAHPAFAAVKGKWGEQGATTVRLQAVDEEALGEALTLAWQNATVPSSGRRAARTRKAPARARPARKKI